MPQTNTIWPLLSQLNYMALANPIYSTPLQQDCLPKVALADKNVCLHHRHIATWSGRAHLSFLCLGRCSCPALPSTMAMPCNRGSHRGWESTPQLPQFVNVQCKVRQCRINYDLSFPTFLYEDRTDLVGHQEPNLPASMRQSHYESKLIFQIMI